MDRPPIYRQFLAMSQATSLTALEAYANSAFAEEDGDDSSDEESDEYMETGRCLRISRPVRKALLPHIYPAFWLALPFVACGILSFCALLDPMLKGKEIQLWRLSVSEDKSAVDFKQNATLVGLSSPLSKTTNTFI